jgi:hypothetical protein
VDAYGNAVDVPDGISPTLTLQWEREEDDHEMADNSMEISGFQSATDILDKENSAVDQQIVQFQRLSESEGEINPGRACSFVPIPGSMVSLASSKPFPRTLKLIAFDANNRFEPCEVPCIVLSGVAETVFIREKGDEAGYSDTCHVEVTGSSTITFELKLLDAFQSPASLKLMKRTACTISTENGTVVFNAKNMKDSQLQSIKVEFNKVYVSEPHLFDTDNCTEFKLICNIAYDGGSGGMMTKPTFIICRVRVLNSISAISVIRLSANGDETEKNNIRCGDDIKCVVKLSTQDKVPYIMSLDEAKESILVSLYRGNKKARSDIAPVAVNPNDGSLQYDFPRFTSPGKYKFKFTYSEHRTFIIEQMHPAIPPQVSISHM